MWSRFKLIDPLLYLVPLILMGVSVVMIYTLTNDTAGTSTAIRQGIFAVGGLLLMVIFSLFDYRNFRSLITWLYSIGIVLLLFVLRKGQVTFGAARWINLGFFQLQPGEIFKLILIIALASLLSQSTRVLSWGKFGWAILLFLIPTFAVLLQPDLGTALVLSATAVGMLFYAHTNRTQRVLLTIGVFIVSGSILLSLNNVKPFTPLLKSYQKQRLTSFIHPNDDPSKTGYNVVQSKIAVGSGGLTGEGLGEGTQSQLNFLPVAQADFIFAGIAEAWGFVGSVGIIVAFFVISIRLFHAARIAKDEFGMLICLGIVIKLLFEVLVNVGMNIGIMPVTGIPLPFLSYGGTTMLTNAMLVGIAQSVILKHKRLTFER